MTPEIAFLNLVYEEVIALGGTITDAYFYFKYRTICGLKLSTNKGELELETRSDVANLMIHYQLRLLLDISGWSAKHLQGSFNDDIVDPAAPKRIACKLVALDRIDNDTAVSKLINTIYYHRV